MIEPHSPLPASTPATHHRLSVQGRIGALHLSFTASLTAPWTVLFGPSGCGKTTLLHALCGLAPGLQVRAERLDTTPTEVLQDAHRSVPPHRRRLALAPQHALLFPHLTVAQNISFGSAVRGTPLAATPLAAHAIELFELEALTRRLPRQLSGGERQRVALARALAIPDTRLVLLDEPFAGVDRALRDRLLPRMQTWLRERNLPVLSVTHDIDEALLFADEVIRLHEGQRTAQGPPQEVLAAERADLLAALRAHPGGP